ncbi:hypothetical protein ACFFQW_31730 [Umezawaea endophytica]|uniref:HTH cro/C1-type domain-containing protein n=1 Tax=Umezawaea endophytica TaxID=1654476 RepID=A0A9X3AJ41_9PSEU|nr:hypothetical protein [Umezawaea endophytica]MCS7484007.1 hypothetical protein [Umezawaea endophytica]
MPRPESPVDPHAGPVQHFAFDLRKLRERAGSPGYRELGRATHYSPTTLAEAARGQRLPSLPVLLAYVRGCGGDEGEWERRWRSLSESRLSVSPYVGLASFGEQDADRFFGRERLLEKLGDRLAERGLVAVVGASGSGKSSLLRAGLLASAGGRARLITPGAHPLAKLDDLRSTTLLVVDQFEEVFTLCGDHGERAAFIAGLVALPHRTRVVLGLRADFYGRCADHPELAEAVEAGQLLVGPMSTEDLRRAITQPSVKAGCVVEADLVARLVADATGEPGVLPHLSHALLETWRRRQDDTLTLAGYEATGGIAGAIAKSAEDVYAEFDEERRTLARQVFLRLIAPGDGTEDTKRRVRRAELDGDHAVVLERLARARLLTVDDDGVELSHEAVLRSWPRLVEWIAEDRAGLRVHRHLTGAAQAWESHGKDAGSLYRGVPLALTKDWAQRDPGVLNERERAFLDASVAAEAGERETARRRTRRLRQLVGVLSVLLVVAVAATVVAVRARGDADAQLAVTLARKAVTDADVLGQTDPALAAQLRLAAYRLAPLPEARDSLLSTFAAPYATRITAHSEATTAAVFHPGGALLATAARDRVVVLWDVRDVHRPRELGRLVGHGDAVHAISFSPDGSKLATASYDGTARLWDVATPSAPVELAVIGAHVGHVEAVAFQADGAALATAGEDGTIRLWDLAEPRHPAPLRTFEGHTALVHGLAISGRVLASAGWDGTTRLWDMDNGLQLSIVDTPPEGLAVAFSHDGRTLATGGGDRKTRLWDVTDPRLPVLLSTTSAFAGMVHGLAFSPDDRMLATATDDKTARLWDVADLRAPSELVAFTGHTDAVWSASFSPDGKTLATTSDDRVVRLEDLGGLAVARHTGAVWSLDFSPDGRTLASGSEDATARTWRPEPLHAAETARLPAHTGPVGFVEYSPRGDVLVTGDVKGPVRLWRGTEPTALPAESDGAVTGAFTADGSLLVTSNVDGLVALWDVTDPLRPRLRSTVTSNPYDQFSNLAISGDGRTLAVATDHWEVALWDVADPDHPVALPPLTGHSGTVSAVAFAGSVLATASIDATAKLWGLADPRRPALLTTLTGHQGPVQRVVFSADHRLVATAGNDETVRVWTVADPRDPLVLKGHSDRIWAVAFSPDGRALASAGGDHTVRMWELDVDRVVDRICSIAAPPISADQWARHFPGLPYRPPCP